MITVSTKKLRRTSYADLEFLGLLVAGKKAHQHTLAFGGRYTEQAGDDLLNGQVVLSVTDGGLRPQKITASEKRLFKNFVKPALATEVKGFGIKYSGTITLHFIAGELTKFTLTP